MNTKKPLPGLRQFRMSYQDIAKALIIEQGIHEGLFRVGLEFGAPGGMNANIMGRMMPAVFIPVMGIVLIEDKEANALSVDAAVVNPRKDIAVRMLKEFEVQQ